MLDILISFLTFVLILASLFMVLVILMQRANSNAGMGSAFGGGVTESAFGAETTNILTRATKWSAVVFFLLSLVLYLLYISQVDKPAGDAGADLPEIPSPAEALPAPEGVADEPGAAATDGGTNVSGTDDVLPTPEEIMDEAGEAADGNGTSPAP